MTTDNTPQKKGLLGAIWQTMTGTDSCCAPGCACNAPPATAKGERMKTLKIYDPPLCCSSGACGPNVDPTLVRFAADLKWLGNKGVAIERFNLAQSPEAFAEDELVRSRLTGNGVAALPLVVADGKVVAGGAYPTRKELAGFLGLDDAKIE